MSYDQPANYCTACGEDFASLYAFDSHRVGKHAYTMAEGLRMDPPREDGRHCLTSHELEDMGWKRDQHRRWRTPARSRPFAERA